MADSGMTNKEMLMLVLEGQDKINSRIDELHEKVNTKICGKVQTMFYKVKSLS